VLRWREEPRLFWRHVLGAWAYPQQIAIAEAVRDHPRVAVVGCNSSGKDWAAARVMLWWELTRYPAITVVIGPTHRQVHDIVWKEARAAYNSALAPLGGQMYQTARWEFDERHYAVGFATDDEFNIQGFHSPNLLVILTEAHNVPQSHVEAVKRLNPARILMTGNAFATGGEFHAAFAERGDMWRTIRIAAADTPNVAAGRVVIPGMVTREDVEQRRLDWGEDSAMYKASVLAEFPEDLEDVVVPRSLVLEAVGRELPEPGEGDGGDGPPVVLACDVARFGEDKTVVYERRGGACRLLWKAQGRDTQQVAGKLGLLAEERGAAAVVVDDTGVGGGVTDRLRESGPPGVKVIAFNGGAAAEREDRYANAVTEAWLELARAFRDGRISVDDNPALVAQLSTRRYSIQGDRRLKLESKQEYKARTGRSPDDADALAMAWSPLARPKSFSVRFLP
jgi:hypothetical protein